MEYRNDSDTTDATVLTVLHISNAAAYSDNYVGKKTTKLTG